VQSGTELAGAKSRVANIPEAASREKNPAAAGIERFLVFIWVHFFF